MRSGLWHMHIDPNTLERFSYEKFRDQPIVDTVALEVRVDRTLSWWAVPVVVGTMKYQTFVTRSLFELSLNPLNLFASRMIWTSSAEHLNRKWNYIFPLKREVELATQSTCIKPCSSNTFVSVGTVGFQKWFKFKQMIPISLLSHIQWKVYSLPVLI